MEIQKTNQNLPEQEKVINIGREIYKLNTIVSYPYSDELIELMAKNILRLMPEIKIYSLSAVIDKFITGTKIYNKDGGLSQIIAAIKVQEQLEKENTW